MRSPNERLKDIAQAIMSIERYSHITYVELENNELLLSWFLRQLQIIGEASRALPQNIRAMAEDTSWAEIISLRNILVHQYFEIDSSLV